MLYAFVVKDQQRSLQLPFNRFMDNFTVPNIQNLCVNKSEPKEF